MKRVAKIFNQRIMTWQAVFYDFDGVILDSVDIETKAFAKMFEQYGLDIQRKVVQYLLENAEFCDSKKFFITTIFS